MSDDRPTVLFVCVHNAGRSQMAAGYLQHLAGDRVRVLSAGSQPADEVNPAASITASDLSAAFVALGITGDAAAALRVAEAISAARA